MLSRFVTTSRTRIINPRYVVPCTLYLLVITAPSLFSSFSLSLLSYSRLFLWKERERERESRCSMAYGVVASSRVVARKKHLRLFFHLPSPLNTRPSFATAPRSLWPRLEPRGTTRKFFFCCISARYTRAYKRLGLGPRGDAGGRNFYDFLLRILYPCVLPVPLVWLISRATAVNWFFVSNSSFWWRE